MNKDKILAILETAVDKNGNIPMRLVRLAFKKLPEPCEDAVSRVDVLECFSDLYDTFEDCSKGIVNELHRKFDDLRTLPSVTPKQRTGKWTKDCACEICGFKPWYERDIHTLSFCPNCGADMREDNNG